MISSNLKMLEKKSPDNISALKPSVSRLALDKT
jgi:hypothetical protein